MYIDADASVVSVCVFVSMVSEIRLCWPATASKVHYARSRIVTLHNGSCKWTASGRADMQGAADVFVVLAVPQSKVVYWRTGYCVYQDSTHVCLARGAGQVPHLPGRWRNSSDWEIDSPPNGRVRRPLIPVHIHIHVFIASPSVSSSSSAATAHSV